MELFTQVVAVCSGITSISALLVFLVKPIRERVLNDKKARNGQKCLLRSDMLRTYYRHKDEGKIRQYEFENFMLEYAAYKALDGNSFIDRVKDDIKQMEVVS